MAGFILCDNRVIKDKRIEMAKKAFHNKSYHLNEYKIELGDHLLLYFSKHNDEEKQIFKNEQGDTICVSGSILVNGNHGQKAIKSILERLVNNESLENIDITGNYVLIVFINGKLLIASDLFRGEVCYTNTEKTWFTSNFLAAILLNEHNKFNKQELLEYLLFGFVFGDESIISGINYLDTTKVYDITSKKLSTVPILIPEINNNYKSCIYNTIDLLINEFEEINEAFPNEIVSALSGGFDTRLMLALQLKIGNDPNLYVYGSDNHKEVVIAKRIAHEEKLQILHIDKSKYATVDVGDFSEIVNNNFWGQDGFVNVGFLGDQSDLQERINRGISNGIVLNGAGGEIYRDVWNWSFYHSSFKNLFKASYDTGELNLIGIDPASFFSVIGEKILIKTKKYLNIDNKINRQQADHIFPIYRSNFYFSNNTLDNYFSNSLLPFMTKKVVQQSYSIPYKFKYNGKFEMDLISALNPKLAAYPSSYGYNFIDGAGNNLKIKNKIYRLIPPNYKASLKKFLGSSKKSFFKSGTAQNLYLNESYLSQILVLKELQIMPVFKNINLLNQQILNRIYSMEYLSQRLNIGIDL